METRRLQAFIKIVDLGSLTRAAEFLCVAQPALSQQVVSLEHDFGVPLLKRSRSGVTPTPAGRALYRHAQVILKQLSQARSEVKHISAEITGVVSMGMPLSSAIMIIGPLLELMRGSYPGVQLHVSDGLTGTALRERTITGQLDIALLPGTRPLRGMGMQPLFSEQLVFVASESAAKRLPAGPVDIADLENMPLALPSRHTHLRELIEDAFAARNCPPQVIADMDMAYSLCSAVSRNLASTILPAASARHAGAGLAIRPFKAPGIERCMSLATFEGTPLSAPAAAVYGLLLEVTTRLIVSGEWRDARLPESAAAAAA